MKTCSQCFTDILDEIAVCPMCGAAIVAPEAEAAAAEGVVELSEEALAFRRQFEEREIFLPGKVLKRTEELLARAGAELRRATVLMVDLCGFTRAGTQMNAEELSNLASAFYKVCSDCIIRRGGFVVKFIGDAALAVFGAPVAYDRDTENAVYAGLDIRERFRYMFPEGGPGRAVSIGLATGIVRSGVIETPAGRSFDILGDTVNLCARLQAQAGTNTIFVCQETRHVIERQFITEPTQPLKLKNFSEGYVAYKIVEEKRLPLPRRIFDTPFAGREKELASLTRFVVQAMGAGEASMGGKPAPRVAHVKGEAGLGKSRLVHEALAAAGATERAMLWEASPGTANILLHPVLEWMRRELGLTQHDSSSSIQEAIQHYLKIWLPQEEGAATLLGYVFGVPEAIRALQGMPPLRIQQNLFGLIRQIIQARARSLGQGGLILVADDVQWADSMTVSFLLKLMDWPEDADAAAGPDAAPIYPISLILIYRTEDKPPVERAQDHVMIQLMALRSEERLALLERLVPADEFPEEIRQMILSKGSGNPLFLEEMKRLAQRLMVENPDMSPEKMKAKIGDSLPTSLHDLILSRIDRLEINIRQVLQCASLLGVEFAFTLIEMFDIIREGLSDHIQTLCDVQYLEELGELPPSPRDFHYYFTHGLFRDVAYSTLLDEQKRKLHLTLAKKLEERFTDRLSEYHELLAFHFSRGADPQKALYHLIKAGDRQLGMGGAARALDNYSEAIEILRQMPSSVARNCQMARVLNRCGRLNRTMGRHAEADEMFLGALECAKVINNERMAVETRLEQALSLMWRMRSEEARPMLETIRQDAARLANPNVEMLAMVSLANIHLFEGRLQEAAALNQAIIPLAQKGGAPHVQADALNNAGFVYWRLGQYAQAMDCFKRSLPLRNQVNDRYGLCATLMNMGIIQEQLGEVGAANQSYMNALNLAGKTGYVQALAALESNLSNLQRRSGTVAAALEHATRAVDFSRRAMDPMMEAIGEENVGLALAARGEYAEARGPLERALAIARDRKLHEKEAGVAVYLLDNLCDQGKTVKAGLDELNEWLRKIEAGGYADMAPRVWRVKARMVEALGEAAAGEPAARECLEKSLALARGMGNMFEELDSLRRLQACRQRQGDAAGGGDIERQIKEIEARVIH